MTSRGGAVRAPLPPPAQLQSRDVTIAGYEGAGIVVSVIETKGRTGTGPGIFHTHCGGMRRGRVSSGTTR